MVCLDCGEGFHELCDPDSCCCNTNRIASSDKESEQTEAQDSEPGDRERKSSHTPKRHGRSKKNDINLKDPHSTGRKRAAVLYKIDHEAPCDWRNKANCGGGLKPIVGCVAGFQENIHHGPNKNTLHNERENIHLICSTCHNRWHAENDPTYDPEAFHEPHKPREAGVDDWIASFERWNDVHVKHVRD